MKGSLVCVGVGMTLGSHLTPLSRSYIEQADVVFTGLSDGVIELWLAGMSKDVRSLQQYYREGKSRRETYQQMVEAMLTEVRAGKRVCGAFYGHPGVFALPPHKAIERARREGYAAHMEPGVSAEDCLYADLGIDPGQYGCQHYEASQLLLYRRRIDPSAYLILWQIGVVGDRSLARFSTGPAHRQVLVDVLARDYPLDHEVILYKAATLPMHRPRIEKLALGLLPTAATDMHATLVVPPAAAPEPDPTTRRRLAALDMSIAEKGSIAAVAESGSPREPDVGANTSAREQENQRAGGLAAAAVEFATGRLVMRPLSGVDAAIFQELYTDAQTMQFIGTPLSPERATRSFRKYMKAPAAKQLLFAIREKAGGPAIGICAVQQLDEQGRRAELGIMLRPAVHGQGFAKESLSALIAHAFKWLAVDELWARVAAAHAVVERLVLSVGFVRRNHAATEVEYPGEAIWSIRREI